MHHLRPLPPLARHINATMPWITLLTGCLAGTGLLAVLAHVASTSHGPLDQGTVRLAFLPAVAAMAFLLRTPFRPVTATTPVPVWVAPAGHLLLAAPVLAVTCWAQLRIVARTVPPHTIGHPPAVYPVIAQLAGWCAITIAGAACVDRSRYADLGGAIAAPAGFAVIAVAWYSPVTSGILTGPPATANGVTTAWYAIAAAALALTCAAMRDRWHRPLAGEAPDVPQESSLNLPRPVPGQLVEDVTQLFVMRRGRGEHHDRGVPVPHIGPERGPLGSGDPGACAVLHDVDEQLGGRAERRAVVP